MIKFSIINFTRKILLIFNKHKKVKIIKIILFHSRQLAKLFFNVFFAVLGIFGILSLIFVHVGMSNVSVESKKMLLFYFLILKAKETPTHTTSESFIHEKSITVLCGFCILLISPIIIIIVINSCAM